MEHGSNAGSLTGQLGEYATGAISNAIDNPVDTVNANLGSIGTGLVGQGLGLSFLSPPSLALGLVGRGIDSYRSSVQSDKDLQATGVQATGPMGQDWTTSAIRDFVPGFLGGRSSEDQAKDIAEEVSGLQNDWFDLDNIDAGGALDRSIMGNNSNYGSRTNLDMPDQAHRSLSPTNTAINQFYDRDTKEYVNMLNGERSPDWDGNQVIDSYNQASQRMRTAPIYTQGLAPPPGAQSQWRNPNNPPPLNLNIAQSQIDADAATANAYAADQAAMAAATDAANAAAYSYADGSTGWGGGSGGGGDSAGWGGCYVTTALAEENAITPAMKRRAVVWCLNTQHDTLRGRIWRTGYHRWGKPFGKLIRKSNTFKKFMKWSYKHFLNHKTGQKFYPVGALLCYLWIDALSYALGWFKIEKPDNKTPPATDYDTSQDWAECKAYAGNWSSKAKKEGINLRFSKIIDKDNKITLEGK